MRNIKHPTDTYQGATPRRDARLARIRKLGNPIMRRLHEAQAAARTGEMPWARVAALTAMAGARRGGRQ